VGENHLHTREATTVVPEHISQEVGKDEWSDARRMGTQQDTQWLVTEHLAAEVKERG
jgi:hypothetical protein